MPRKAPKTFEQLAIENGLVTDVQVQEGLAVQEDARKDARMPESLETIMLSKGFMTQKEVHAVKTALGRMTRDEEKGEPLYIANYDVIGKIDDGGLGTVLKPPQ